MHLTLLVFLLTGCSVFNFNSSDKQRTTKAGVKYVISEKGAGRKPEPGEKIKIHFVGKLPSGEIFANSYEKNYPIVFQLGARQVIAGWDNVFPKFTEGTVATLTIPPHLAYGESGLGKVPPNTTLTYIVELLDIVEPPVPFNVTDKDTFQLESGLKYIVSESYEGRKAESFRTVHVHYTGYLENGNIFDSSVDRGFPFMFQLGLGQVISGWEEGILRMKENDKFRFIVPPELAYGQKGFPPGIPPEAILIYDVELLKVE